MLHRFEHGTALQNVLAAPEAGHARAFRFGNGNFESGDADYWYQFVRTTRPNRIIEIGSGHSTLLTRVAIAGAQSDAPGYTCEHICIEPYEMPWLESEGVKVIRSRVEDLETTFFGQLEAGDVLFIDSSHVIRPQGDVLFEFLELLPKLKVGVVVHVHDIFTPKDYPATWITGEVRFWNEQYLLEAFLSHNSQWQILGALNFLHHHFPEALAAKCPFLTPDREPGSFYIQRVA
jgi:hypothetical protein